MSKYYQQEDVLREMYINRGMKMSEIADELECTATTICKYLNKFGIEKEYKDEELLREMYLDRDMSQREIAKELDCGKRTVARYMYKYNIPMRETGRHQSFNVSKDKLSELYIDNNMTIIEVSDELDSSSSTIERYLKKYNIPIRSLSDYYDSDPELRQTVEYREWRRKVYERDNYTCQDCGVKNCLHAHHIVPISESKDMAYDVDNGIIVCSDCHADRHEKRGDWYANMIRKSYIG